MERPRPSPGLNLFLKAIHHAPSIEKGLFAVLLLGILLFYFSVTGKALVLISMALLSIVYFLRSLRGVKSIYDEDPNAVQPGVSDLVINTIGPRLLWIGTSVIMFGIWAYLMNFGNMGFLNPLRVGAVAVGAVLAILIYAGITEPKRLVAYGPILLRALPLLAIDLYILRQVGSL